MLPVATAGTCEIWEKHLGNSIIDTLVCVLSTIEWQWLRLDSAQTDLELQEWSSKGVTDPSIATSVNPLFATLFHTSEFQYLVIHTSK